MDYLICQGFFLILEVLMNIISLIILPKPFQFEKEDELSSLKKQQLQL